MQHCVGVVLPHREGPDAVATLTTITPSEALAELLAARLASSGPSPEEAWDYLTRLVAGLPVARLDYGHPREGAEALARLLG